MTSARGVDTAIEAVGVPATFVLCEDIVAPGGTIANAARGPGGSASRTPVVAEHHDHDPSVDTVTTPMLLDSGHHFS